MASKFIYIDKDAGTTAIRERKTGRLEGRKDVRGKGDGTFILRNRKTGQIFGRTPKPFKGSRRGRGGIR